MHSFTYIPTRKKKKEKGIKMIIAHFVTFIKCAQDLYSDAENMLVNCPPRVPMCGSPKPNKCTYSLTRYFTK